MIEDIRQFHSPGRHEGYAAVAGAAAGYTVTAALLVGQEPVSAQLTFQAENFLANLYTIGQPKQAIAMSPDKPEALHAYEAANLIGTSAIGAVALATASLIWRKQRFINKTVKQFKKDFDLEVQFLDK